MEEERIYFVNVMATWKYGTIQLGKLNNNKFVYKVIFDLNGYYVLSKYSSR